MTFRDDAYKFWLKSKTVLWNAVLVLAGLWSTLESYVPHLNVVLGDKWFGIVMFLVGVIGIALRFATSTPIVKPKKGDPNGIVSRT